MKIRLTLLALALLVAPPHANSEEASPQTTISGQERAEELHEMAPEEFGELVEAGEEIDFEHIDQHLLAAAVFHETNRRRIDHDLEPLGYKHGLREAARIQASGMRREEIVSHQHPDESKETLTDRLSQLEIKGRYFAENVAMTFGVRYESGKPFHTRQEDGARIISDQPDGAPIPPHTYLSFAEALLDEWMDSPGHRENIVAAEPRLLGTSSLHDRTPDGMDRFYSVQVFFAPFE